MHFGHFWVIGVSQKPIPYKFPVRERRFYHAKGEDFMFGQMNVEPLLRLQNDQGKPAPDLESAMARLLEVTEQPKVVRWIQFPAAVLVFLVVPHDPESGAFYVYDRKRGTWFWVDFDDNNFGGYMPM